MIFVDFDDTEHDEGFYEKESIKITKKPYEVDYKVLSPADIEAQQNKQINEVMAILGLPPESPPILLRLSRWNKEKLIEGYMDHPEETLEAAGLGPGTPDVPQTKIVPGFTCEICFEDNPDMQTYAMVCEHRYCVDCYGHYLTQKIKEEGEAARIQCPRDGCHRIMDSKSIRLLIDDATSQRYAHPVTLSSKPY